MSPPPSAGPRPKGLRFSRIAFVALLVTPILEIMVIVAVGQAIGGWWTFALLLAMSVFGAWLIRREGSRAWRALNQALRSGRMPARELADAIGLFLVLPFTRPVARGLLETVITRHLIAGAGRFGGPPVTGQPWDRQAPQGPRRSASSDDVVEGEIIDDD
jgi:UPF0716 protein FxsA